jgi:serine/threonine-protein kinase
MAGRFGPYELGPLLGRGGMGVVHRAYDTEQAREVALKLLPEHLATDAAFVERFRNESFAAARLTDPHVVPIHRFGEIDGRLYIDMRLVEGSDLARTIAADGPLGPERAVSFVVQAAQALDAAHAAGLVHRDVKPSNLLVTPTDFVYLVDFGIAHAIGRAGTGLTARGFAVGCADYLSPERIKGGAVDHRADVYALGCVLHEALTGRTVFSAPDPTALVDAHLHATPQRPSELVPDLPAGLDEVVLRALAKDPEERFPSAGELAADAQAALRRAGRTVSVPVPRARADAASAAVPATRRPPTAQLALPPWAADAAAAGGGPEASRPPVPAPREPVAAGPLPAGPPHPPGPAPAGGVPFGGAPAGAVAPDAARRRRLGLAGAAAGALAVVVLGAFALVDRGGDEPAPVGTTSAARDLGLPQAVSVPECDGSYAVFVGAATVPSAHADDVRRLLTAHPGARYLHSVQGCPSLRDRLDDGRDFYAVYLGPFATAEAACAARAAAGDEAYVRPLDTTSAPGAAVDC